VSPLSIRLGLAVILAAAVASAAQAGPTAAEAPRHARLDPYKTFRFRVLIDGRCVAGFQTAVFPTARPDVLRSPVRSQYEAITLERGLTHDTGFASWAQGGARSGRSGPTAANLRRDVRIAVIDEAGRPAGYYAVRRAWASEYNALPDLDAGANAIAIEHLKLENEGWERDTRATETPPC
jgi:phage tail-like protein